MSDSPFEFKIEDGLIVRYKKEDGLKQGSINPRNIEKLRDYIAGQDELLWSLRKINREDTEKLRERIHSATAALNG